MLLCEKDQSKKHLIEHLEIDTDDDLEKIDVSRIKYPKKRMDFKSNKWTFYFLEQDEIDFIEKILHDKSIRQLRDYAKVEVGITTGYNQFFSITESTMNEYNLKKYTTPMIGKSVNVPSLIFGRSDWEYNVKNNVKSYLLTFPTRNKIKGTAWEYIKKGENCGIQKLYKCRIRNEWYRVPSTHMSEAMFQRRSNIYPKFMLNEAKVLTADTMYRVTVNGKINLRSLIASYYNSLSLAFTEICGRSYGGGVLELMPNEVEDVLIPYNEKNHKMLSKIDMMIRNKISMDEILKYTDESILKERCGFSDSEIKMANNIWRKLSSRILCRIKK